MWDVCFLSAICPSGFVLVRSAIELASMHKWRGAKFGILSSFMVLVSYFAQQPEIGFFLQTSNQQRSTTIHPTLAL